MKFIDLFAGIGGFHQAAKQLGWQCVFASEIDKYACKTYEANHGIKPHGDIKKIDAKDIPDHDILFAGFPCQAFSVAGKRLGFEDTRGTLFFEIARILKEKQPKMFLLENVKGLKSHDNGKTLETILNTLFSLGYTVNSNILNAKDYGVPQNRERIFLFGSKEPMIFEWPEPQEKVTLSHYFGGYWAKDTAHTVRASGRGSRINDKHNWDSYKYLSESQINYHINRKKEQQKKGNGFGATIITLEVERTNTLSAQYYKDGSEILLNDTFGIRKLTPRECGLLQGFPEDFIIPVSNAQAYKQFGNAVCVNVVREIIKKIR